VEGLRVGYFPAWMKEDPATNVDRAALEVIKKLGMVPVEVMLPDWPYDSLDLILFAEGAAAFEELTLSGALNQLKVQVPDAWPNLFRQSRFLSAVDFVQSDRFRRKVAEEMARVFSRVDLLLCLRCGTKCLRLRTSPAIPHLHCVRALSKCRRRAATGRPIRTIRCRSFLRRVACPTASP